MVRDAVRDAWLNSQGIMVHRVPAGDLLAEPDDTADGVIALALDRMAELGTTEDPPPTAFGGPPSP